MRVGKREYLSILPIFDLGGRGHFVKQSWMSMPLSIRPLTRFEANNSSPAGKAPSPCPTSRSFMMEYSGKEY
jgi:hypothetical protein